MRELVRMAALAGWGASRRLVPVTMAVAALALLPYNIGAGWFWRDWYVQGMKSVEADISNT